MRIELNEVGQVTYNAARPNSERLAYRDTRRRQNGGTLPMLDWPENLFSSPVAMADESAAYQ